MRGAPQRGLLRLSIRIRSRISCGMPGRPGLPRRTRHVQNKRKPLRCQATTVSGLTIINAWSQRAQTHLIQTQNARSDFVSRNRFGADRRSTPSCCRKARFSRRSSAEVLNHAAAAASSAAAIPKKVRNNVRRRAKSNHPKAFGLFVGTANRLALSTRLKAARRGGESETLVSLSSQPPRGDCRL